MFFVLFLICFGLFLLDFGLDFVCDFGLGFCLGGGLGLLVVCLWLGLDGLLMRVGCTCCCLCISFIRCCRYYNCLLSWWCYFVWLSGLILFVVFDS